MSIDAAAWLGPHTKDNWRQFEQIVPMCAICNRKVERVIQLPMDPATRTYSFRVECHGDEETTTLEMELFMDMRNMAGGVAFATKRICEATA